MVDIDRSVKAYYEQTELSEEQLQKLTSMQDDMSVSIKQTPPKQWFRRSALAVASFLVAVTLFIVSAYDDSSIIERVAQEVAMNHNKALTVEYRVDSYEALSQQMDKLEFMLRAPMSDFNKGLALIGGRYCSIQGELAAQIKMVDEAGRVYTLYQTRSSESINTINSDRVSLDNVSIRLWREQGLFFALAETVE